MPKKKPTPPTVVVPATDGSLDQASIDLKDQLTNMDEATFARYQSLIAQEGERRDQKEVKTLFDKIRQLSPAQQQRLTQLQAQPVKSSRERQSDPLRMYKYYPSKKQPEYRIAPFVNLELRDMFPGGSPRNKSWLRDLDTEQRKEKYGTIEQLKDDPGLLETFKKIPNAVYYKEGDKWEPCRPQED